MGSVCWSELAEQDLREAWRYIAADNPDAADRLLKKIDVKLQQYAVRPGMGTPRESIAAGLRSFPVGKYVVFYRCVTDGIEVARFLHGARDLTRAFGEGGG